MHRQAARGMHRIDSASRCPAGRSLSTLKPRHWPTASTRWRVPIRGLSWPQARVRRHRVRNSRWTEQKSDGVKHIGYHTIFFAFRFCGQKYCFARATEDADNAFLCKENHDLMGPYRMKDEFVNWLKVQYHMDFDGLSFRIALSSFFRIYGKDNTDERRLLRGIPGQDMEKSIALLVALFDRNKDIQV